MISSANRIYSEFVQTEAPKQVKETGPFTDGYICGCGAEDQRVFKGTGVSFQVNIDCGTRENITKNMCQPSLTSFDTAQKLIYSLMARDCYPRFLKSDIYQGLLRRNESR